MAEATVEPRSRSHPSIAPWRRAALRLLRVRVRYRPETLATLADGPVIVLCAHRSYLDGVIVALASPRPLVFAITPRHAVRNRWTATGIAMMSHLGLGDRVAVDAARPAGLRGLLRALQAGGSIAVFPEGRIRAVDEATFGGVDEARGWRWLVDRSGAGVVRLSLSGAEHAWPFAPRGRRVRPPITLEF